MDEEVLLALTEEEKKALENESEPASSSPATRRVLDQADQDSLDVIGATTTSRTDQVTDQEVQQLAGHLTAVSIKTEPSDLDAVGQEDDKATCCNDNGVRNAMSTSTTSSRRRSPKTGESVPSERSSQSTVQHQRLDKDRRRQRDERRRRRKSLGSDGRSRSRSRSPNGRSQNSSGQNRSPTRRQTNNRNNRRRPRSPRSSSPRTLRRGAQRDPTTGGKPREGRNWQLRQDGPLRLKLTATSAASPPRTPPRAGTPPPRGTRNGGRGQRRPSRELRPWSRSLCSSSSSWLESPYGQPAISGHSMDHSSASASMENLLAAWIRGASSGNWNSFLHNGLPGLQAELIRIGQENNNSLPYNPLIALPPPSEEPMDVSTPPVRVSIKERLG